MSTIAEDRLADWLADQIVGASDVRVGTCPQITLVYGDLGEDPDIESGPVMPR